MATMAAKAQPAHNRTSANWTIVGQVTQSAGVIISGRGGRTAQLGHRNVLPSMSQQVWNYPRPPALVPTSARVRVIWRGASGKPDITLADTTKAFRVLETSHPPTYYIPPEDVDLSLLKPSSARRTMCEWKGLATYHDLVLDGATAVAKARIWSYPEPTASFEPIRNYLCFYATSRSDPKQTGAWTCMVDDDVVEAQEGDFYGSWITPEIEGGQKGFKGGPGTWGW